MGPPIPFQPAGRVSELSQACAATGAASASVGALVAAAVGGGVHCAAGGDGPAAPRICPDGVLYIRLAQAVEAGNLQAGFQEMALNIYPVILMAAAPRWGWTGNWRLLVGCDDFQPRGAAAVGLGAAAIRRPRRAGGVSALRGSSEDDRMEPRGHARPDLLVPLYVGDLLLWRAVTEVHYGYFIGAGAAITLASLTRIEGLLLLIPLALWTFWRWLALETGRGKLLLGVTLCMVVFPSLLVSVNLIWLCMRFSGQFEWTGIRLSPLARVQWWLESLLGDATAGSEGSLECR